MRVDVDAEHVRASLRERKRVEAGIAADVQRTHAAHVLRQDASHLRPLEGRKVTQRVIGSSLPAVGEVEVVKPRSQLADLVRECVIAWYRRALRLERHLTASRLRPPTSECNCAARTSAVCSASTRSRAAAPTRLRSASDVRSRIATTSALESTRKISVPGASTPSMPGQRSEMIGTPHAAASNSLTEGE